MEHYFTGCWIRTYFKADLLPIGLCRNLENRNGGRHGGPKKFTLICRNEIAQCSWARIQVLKIKGKVVFEPIVYSVMMEKNELIALSIAARA